jgi:hypothetical protein
MTWLAKTPGLAGYTYARKFAIAAGDVKRFPSSDRAAMQIFPPHWRGCNALEQFQI